MKYIAFLSAFLLCLSSCQSTAESFPDGNNGPNNEYAPESTDIELIDITEQNEPVEIFIKPETEPAPKVSINSNANHYNNSKRVLVNHEIMTYIEQLKEKGEDIEQLIFYLSKSFTMGIEELNDLPNVEIVERLLLVSDKDPVQPVAFTHEQNGTAQPHLFSINSEIVTVNFLVNEQIVPLGFIKNVNNDCYDLYSVSLGPVLYGIQSEEETPRLYIYASIERGNQIIVTYDVQGVPIFADNETTNEYHASPQQHEHAPQVQDTRHPQESPEQAHNPVEIVQQQTDEKTHQPAQQQPAQQNNDRSTFILGEGSLKLEGVIEYIKFKTRSPVLTDTNIRRLVNLYFSEAILEDVNHDLAIAQMLYWTNFLADRERVETNNFGGLDRTREWNGRFPYDRRYDGMTEGVKAHIQHLRLYASNSLKNPNTVNVDPRHLYTEEFTSRITTFNALYDKWTQNTANYRQKVNAILIDLYRFSDRYR